MDSISTANALSLLTKWHDEASVVAFDHGQTGKSCKSWVLVREVISGKNPSVTFLMLHDPFPLRQLSLAKAEFEYGDHRGWSEGGKLVVEQAEELARAMWDVGMCDVCPGSSGGRTRRAGTAFCG